MGSRSSAGPQRTPLDAVHRRLGARMVDFAGWDMPVQYPTGILTEHQAVRTGCGLFDLSHMGRLGLRGRAALDLAQVCLTRDLSGLASGEAAYSLLCLDDGGILDDVIAYVVRADDVSVICNAANRQTVAQWFVAHAAQRALDVALTDRTFATALIGVQGPAAQPLLQRLCSADLEPLRGYAFLETRVAAAAAVVARTGYTGEDGFEVQVEAAAAEAVWAALAKAGGVPCGL